MLNNQIDILSAELTRKLHTAVHKRMYSKYVDRKEKKKGRRRLASAWLSTDCSRQPAMPRESSFRKVEK